MNSTSRMENKVSTYDGSLFDCLQEPIGSQDRVTTVRYVRPRQSAARSAPACLDIGAPSAVRHKGEVAKVRASRQQMAG